MLNNKRKIIIIIHRWRWFVQNNVSCFARAEKFLLTSYASAFHRIFFNCLVLCYFFPPTIHLQQFNKNDWSVDGENPYAKDTHSICLMVFEMMYRCFMFLLFPRQQSNDHFHFIHRQLNYGNRHSRRLPSAQTFSISLLEWFYLFFFSIFVWAPPSPIIANLKCVGGVGKSLSQKMTIAELSNKFKYHLLITGNELWMLELLSGFILMMTTMMMVMPFVYTQAVPLPIHRSIQKSFKTHRINWTNPLCSVNFDSLSLSLSVCPCLAVCCSINFE